MNSLSRAQKKLNRKYSSSKENLYSCKFFQDMCLEFSFVEKKNFFTFEPEECEAARLLKNMRHYNYCYEIEQIIDKVIYSLMAYGKAYLYLKPEYTIVKGKDKTEEKVISGLEIGEIKGFVLKRCRKELKFCCKGVNGTVKELEMSKGELIFLSLKDLGYRKNYFTKMVKKLGKFDVTSPSLMLTKNIDGYDFSAYLKKMKLNKLKVTKDIGCSFEVDGLSDSYILYKKIQKDKLKIKFLNYIIGKINEGITICLKRGDAGKLIVNIKEINYDQLWEDYYYGKITGTELFEILYKS